MSGLSKPARLIDQPGLETLAAAIAPTLRPGDAVLLTGPLGAGKTTLARALIRTVCADKAMEIPSPSYTLVQNYQAPAFTLHHFDLWRLDGPDGLTELGWEDARAGVVVVEWPERLGALQPCHALAITLAMAEADRRLLTVEDGRLS